MLGVTIVVLAPPTRTRAECSSGSSDPGRGWAASRDCAARRLQWQPEWAAPDTRHGPSHLRLHQRRRGRPESQCQSR
eukprot:2827635-Rhodomonas_salina.2